MTYRTVQIPAKELREGAIINTRDGFARVIEVEQEVDWTVKEPLPGWKRFGGYGFYATGNVIITYELLATKHRRETTVLLESMIKTRRA